MDLPKSTRRKKAPDTRHGSIDRDRSCSVCHREGLYRENISGICQPCHRQLPISLKSGPLALVHVERQHANRVLTHLTCRDDEMQQRQRTAAGLLGIDLDRLQLLLDLPAANDD